MILINSITESKQVIKDQLANVPISPKFRIFSRLSTRDHRKKLESQAEKIVNDAMQRMRGNDAGTVENA